MAKIPFNVSARTARLIGRENVSNADGAIIELVKNCYDADAKACVVIFDNKYSQVPNTLSKQEYEKFYQETKASRIIENLYKKDDANYILKPSSSKNDHSVALKFFKSKNNIYIIDNGDGMSDSVIRNHWMTIGTSNKLLDFRTEQGRVKTGAKGIGRFALDRLGKNCEMLTLVKGKKDGYEWKVNWTDFEGQNTNLVDVEADLNLVKNLDLKNKVEEVIRGLLADSMPVSKDFSHGTYIKISDLNDDWDDEAVSRVYRDLELLTPPNEQNIYKIFCLSTLSPEGYGEVVSSVHEDYDYKIVAEVSKNKKAVVRIYRNEFDKKIVDKDLFDRKEMAKFPYNKKAFSEEFFTINTTLAELVPGLPDQQELDLIGPFNFTFYFMKRSYLMDDKKKFFYRHFESSERTVWLKKFGGIKLFRDSFRVRPYGEAGSSSFDWLGLGERAARSPAGVTKKGGGWKVGSNQVAGVVNISRVTNVKFEDKSSREGLQENRSFEIFRKIILGMIDLFEEDRHVVMRTMSLLYSEKYKEEENKNEALDIAVTNQAKKSGANGSTDKDKLSRAVLTINQENQELKEEFRMSRSLASAGLIVSSFSHELKSLSALLKIRNSQLKKVLEKIIKKSDLKKLQDYEDPFLMLKDMAEQDEKLQNWIQFSINSISKDRRKRIDIDLDQYLTQFQATWGKTLDYREAKITVSKPKKGNNILRAFPIDLDSIFTNLLANSLDAFKRQESVTKRREISITLSRAKKFFEISYEDNGPGLDKNIANPYKILEPFFTTKVDKSGRETGTGLGMWIVKNIVDDYKGEIEIAKKRPGFRVKLSFPILKQNGK